MDSKKIVVGVIGSGVMGSGIAQVSAMANHKVLLFDINDQSLVKAKETIGKNLDKGIARGKVSEDQKSQALKNLEFTNKIEDLKVDLIIEAIVEKLEVKVKVFNDLCEINGASCLYATNTSSIPITQIAAGIKYPDRLVGIHFFNPAHIMKLVEIIEGEHSSKESLEEAKEFVSGLNKTTVLAADSPGFIVNRVARHFYVESLRILEESVTDFKSLDDLMRATGFKLGPCQLMDLIGIETNLSVTTSMFKLFNYNSKFKPSRIQQKKVQAGYYGRKTKKGFYTYD